MTEISPDMVFAKVSELLNLVSAQTVGSQA